MKLIRIKNSSSKTVTVVESEATERHDMYNDMTKVIYKILPNYTVNKINHDGTMEVIDGNDEFHTWTWSARTKR